MFSVVPEIQGFGHLRLKMVGVEEVPVGREVPGL